MENISDWAPTIVAIVAFAGLIWRFETRISGVEHRLGERISHLGDRVSHLGERVSHMEGLIEGLNDRVSRIESVLDNYFMDVSKKDDSQ